MVPKQRPSDKGGQELGKSPEDREHGKKILMGPWKKLEKDGRVNRQVSSDADTPQSREAANCSKVWRTGCDEAKDRGDSNCKVKCPSTPEKITTEPPEDSTDE